MLPCQTYPDCHTYTLPLTSHLALLSASPYWLTRMDNDLTLSSPKALLLKLWKYVIHTLFLLTLYLCSHIAMPTVLRNLSVTPNKPTSLESCLTVRPHLLSDKFRHSGSRSFGPEYHTSIDKFTLLFCWHCASKLRLILGFIHNTRKIIALCWLTKEIFYHIIVPFLPKIFYIIYYLILCFPSFINSAMLVSGFTKHAVMPSILFKFHWPYISVLSVKWILNASWVGSVGQNVFISHQSCCY